MDTGNYPIIKAPNGQYDKAPYGETYFHKPTGRPSDGRLIVDFFAAEFGLPFLPPYLEHPGNPSQGVNFAVSHATTLDVSFFEKKKFNHLVDNSLSSQLSWFDQVKPSLCKSTQDCNSVFSKSLFLVGPFGVNDYGLIALSGKSTSQVASYVPLVIRTISNAVEKLIGDGAQIVVVPGIPEIGCTAAILTVFASTNKRDYDAKTGCLRTFNDLVATHNSQLVSAINQLKGKHPNANIVYADFATLTGSFVQSPRQYGFLPSGVLKDCCGSGGQYNYNAKAQCGASGVLVCSNPSAYVTFDGIHYTEAAYHFVANGWLNGPYANPPIKSLA